MMALALVVVIAALLGVAMTVRKSRAKKSAKDHPDGPDGLINLELIIIYRYLVAMEGRIMAQLVDVNTSIQAQTQAIKDLAARYPPPPAATEADLDGVKAGVDANTAAIQGIGVTPPAPPTP